MFLDSDKFSTVIHSTPLISIDLVIINNEGQVLLGKRLNRPAKHFWFVPGGRILKNETMEKAFIRLTQEELGQVYKIEQAKLLGAYEHFYDDNVFNDKFSTHYVVLAYILKVGNDLSSMPLNIQHDNYQWFEIEELSNNNHIHRNTKSYFTN
jgi:colanic acid biosynthesis protein WcaH